MGRFTIGQKIPFVCVRSTLSGIDNYYGRFIPLGAFVIQEVSAHMMECVETHQVPWEHDPMGAAKYDGYIFEDVQTGDRWNNQYPFAEYSQTETHGDWIISRYVKDPLFIAHRHCARHYLDRIKGDMLFLERVHLQDAATTQENRGVITDHIERYQKHYTQVVEMLKDHLGINVRYEEKHLRDSEGSVVSTYSHHTLDGFE